MWKEFPPANPGCKPLSLWEVDGSDDIDDVPWVVGEDGRKSLNFFFNTLFLVGGNTFLF